MFFWLTAPTNSGVRAANLFELLRSGHGDASRSWPTNLVILRHGSPWYPGGFEAPIYIYIYIYIYTYIYTLIWYSQRTFFIRNRTENQVAKVQLLLKKLRFVCSGCSSIIEHFILDILNTRWWPIWSWWVHGTDQNTFFGRRLEYSLYQIYYPAKLSYGHVAEVGHPPETLYHEDRMLRLSNCGHKTCLKGFDPVGFANYQIKITIPICSMYGIFTYICPNHHPNVGKYTMHGAYGICGVTQHAGKKHIEHVCVISVDVQFLQLRLHSVKLDHGPREK